MRRMQGATAPAIRIEIRPISVDQWLDQAGDLLAVHAAERSSVQHLAPMVPDRERYLEMEQRDVLLLLGAFDGEKLVGYAVSLIARHHRYAFTVAQNDLLYVQPKYRGRGVGRRLIAETEGWAHACGTRLCLWLAKPDSELHELLPTLGYELAEIAFAKELG